MSQDGVITTMSARGFGETIARLQAALSAKGMTVFATIDHAAIATEVGMTLRPTTVLIVGNPRAGTTLMQAQQTIGLDLPLKMLIWEDAATKVWISYDDPAWLAKRHGIDPSLPPIAAMSAGLAGLAQAAANISRDPNVWTDAETFSHHAAALGARPSTEDAPPLRSTQHGQE